MPSFCVRFATLCNHGLVCNRQMSGHFHNVYPPPSSDDDGLGMNIRALVAFVCATCARRCRAVRGGALKVTVPV